MDTIQWGSLRVSRMILGGNPFSGFSHQTWDLDREMTRYFTTAHIKETMRQAEALSINTFLGRADAHIRRTLLEYWDEGGAIQWFAQTAPEFSSLSGNVAGAINTGAAAVYIHGGQMDFFYAQNQLDIVPDIIAQIKVRDGLPALPRIIRASTSGPMSTLTWISTCARITTPRAATRMPNTFQERWRRSPKPIVPLWWM